MRCPKCSSNSSYMDLIQVYWLNRSNKVTCKVCGCKVQGEEMKEEVQEHLDSLAIYGYEQPKLEFTLDELYVARSGDKVRLICVDKNDPQYPIVGLIEDSGGINRREEVATYTKQGKHNICGRESAYDIVGYWKPQLDFDWDCLPKWADKSIAMSSTGSWLYSSEILKLNKQYSHWTANSVITNIPPAFWPRNYPGDYTKSLYINPKYLDNK